MVAGALPILLGLCTLWLSRDLGVGTLTNPGAGRWPTIVGCLRVFTGAAIVLEARRDDDTEAFTRQAWAVGLGAASLALYAYLFELVGFEIPTIGLMVLWIRFLGRESWRTTAITAVVSTAAAYALFITGLGVPLPHLIAF
jgi:putative tricarboxylic transport membrane protein